MRPTKAHSGAYTTWSNSHERSAVAALRTLYWPLRLMIIMCCWINIVDVGHHWWLYGGAVVSVVVQRSAFFQTGGFVSFDSRLAALSASLSPPSTQQQHSDRAVAAAAARSSLDRLQWQVLLLLHHALNRAEGWQGSSFLKFILWRLTSPSPAVSMLWSEGGLARWGESCSSPSLVCLLSSTVR